MDFPRPIQLVGFTIGPAFNPGYSIRFFDMNDSLLGEILNSQGASSFAGASSTVPIDHIIIDRVERSYAIARLGFSFAPEPVPEPSTLVLFALGLGGLGIGCWRRRGSR